MKKLILVVGILLGVFGIVRPMQQALANKNWHKVTNILDESDDARYFIEYILRKLTVDGYPRAGQIGDLLIDLIKAGKLDVLIKQDQTERYVIDLLDEVSTNKEARDYFKVAKNLYAGAGKGTLIRDGDALRLQPIIAIAHPADTAASTGLLSYLYKKVLDFWLLCSMYRRLSLVVLAL